MECQAQNPKITRLPVTSSPEEVAEVLRRDGGVIISGLLTSAEVDQIEEEIKPHWKLQGVYVGDMHGTNDPPLSGLAGKSKTVANRILNHDLYREVTKLILRDVTYVWWGDTRSKCVSDPVLGVSQAFTRGPKTKAQPLHRDDVPQHFEHEEGSGDSSLLGILVAGTKCTYENGATQVIVGSHLWGDDRAPDPTLCSTAEMERGDATIIMGSVWHGAGANITSDQRRNIYSMHMVKGFLKGDENQWLAIPQDVVRSYPPQVQALIGYSVSEPYCGWVELDDPIGLLSGDKLKSRDLMGITVEGPGSEQMSIAAVEVAA